MDFITTTRAVPQARMPDKATPAILARPVGSWVAIGLPPLRLRSGFRSFGPQAKTLGISEKLQRYIPMLLGRVLVTLGLEHLQGVNQLFVCVLRADEGVDIAAR